MYKKLPTNVRSLQLNVTPEEFKKEWTACITDKTADLTRLIAMMEPTFDHWEKMLTSGGGGSDINFLTLCQLISKDSDEALNNISLWVDSITHESSVKSEILYIFLERMRKFRYVPTLANAEMIEYIVARDLKLGIYHHIRYTLRLCKRDAFYRVVDAPGFQVAVQTELPDFILLAKMKINLTKWQSYLFYLISQGYTTVKRSAMTKTHRRNLYKEEQKIWDSLKQML
ncbi:MAG: hypothetical protein CMF69_00395 [Magnetovibrio sp.]|nr:hypothetical protein [Magnetovibrio sp.]